MSDLNWISRPTKEPTLLCRGGFGMGAVPLCAPAEFVRNHLLICLGNVQADPEKAGGKKQKNRQALCDLEVAT